MSDTSVPPRPIAVGDRVRELQTNEQRYVLDVIDDGDKLIVLDDESRAKTSNRRRWLAQNCVIVVRCPFRINDEVTLGNGNARGKVVEIKPHYHGKWLMFGVERPKPSGGTMLNWANEGALHLVTSTAPESAQVEPVAYKSSATESAADDMPAPDAHSRDLLMRAAKELGEAHEATAVARRERDAARLEAANLEKQLMTLQNMVIERKPVPVAQLECVEARTIWQMIATPEQSKDADAELSKMRTAGWCLIHTVYSSDLSKRALMMENRTVTSPQPTRGTAGHHATLTGDFPRHSRSPFRTPTPDTINPEGELVEASKRHYNTDLADLTHAFGVDAVNSQLDKIAVNNALSRRAERGTPIYQALIPLKAGN